MSNRPETGIILSIVDDLRHHDGVLTEPPRYLAAITIGPRVFVVSTEGVGDEVTTYRPWGCVGSDGLDRAFTRSEIADLVTTSTDHVALEDHIRTFGARLESNFRMWKATLHDALELESSFDK